MAGACKLFQVISLITMSASACMLDVFVACSVACSDSNLYVGNSMLVCAPQLSSTDTTVLVHMLTYIYDLCSECVCHRCGYCAG